MSYYSPHTFEHIRTDNPADWMLSAPVAAPDYDTAVASAFWRGDYWDVVESHPEAPTYRDLTSLEFLDLFTDDEQVAVVAATMTSPIVKLWYDKMIAAMSITLSDPRTEAGLDALVDAGLLSVDRKAEIVEAMK